jgi:carboxylesterase type B
MTLRVHGGSFIVGSASDPLLDGSKLATATGSIVAVIQYRLGAVKPLVSNEFPSADPSLQLGFMPPSGLTNLAVKDVMTGLSFIRTTFAFFDVNNPRITLAGQSSGANLISALLAVPSAGALFQGAILESDPMDFRFLSPATQQKLQAFYNTQIGCAPTDTTCQAGLSIDDIIRAELTLFGAAAGIDGSAGESEPWRPVHDGVLITSPLDSTAPFPHVTKPVLVTSVANDAAEAVFAAFPNAVVGAAGYRAALDGVLGGTRGDDAVPTTRSGRARRAPADRDSDYRLCVPLCRVDICAQLGCARWDGVRGRVPSRLGGSAKPADPVLPAAGTCVSPG